MFFIHPMWDSESQRIGMQRCTPAGYVLHAIGEMIGFVGLLMLLAAPVILAWKSIMGTLTARDFWLLAPPFGFGILSEFLVQGSWWLALRKGYRYDYERGESHWIEQGERRSYKYPLG